MAGETSKTTALTNREAGIISTRAKGRLVTLLDAEEIVTTELEVGDNVIFDMPIPSNAVILEVAIYNDDLDGATSLVLDVGLAAGEAYDSVTSGTKTRNAKDAIIDADLMVDGSTVGQAATTSYTVQALDSATLGPDDAKKQIWQLLGYDFDPQTFFNVSLTASAAAGTPATGDLALRVQYLID